jgi:hypothetical protein
MKTGNALLIIAAVFFAFMGYDRYQQAKQREAAEKIFEKDAWDKMSQCRTQVDLDLGVPNNNPALFAESQAQKRACIEKAIEDIKAHKLATR